MNRQGADTERNEGSELARAVRWGTEAAGPHPMAETLFRRDRKSDEARRLTEFLRIDRGRLA